ncbi:hypothetical protein MKX01_017872 [Papaver californicum]|nr:hypothetical protein MKX01_017872 [Papaver californicum]
MVKFLKTALLLLVSTIFFFVSVSHSLPLSTNGRWVVDTSTGDRVKLRCVNWASHMQTMLVEGLDKKPLPDVVKSMSTLGFNCVRLTWATYTFTKQNYRNLTVDHVGENDFLWFNNPGVLNLTILESYDEVVSELGKQRIMAVLDNHVNMPQWCCGESDENGFFGDKFFDPKEWIHGLDIVANRFKGKPQVFSCLRNELRRPRQNKDDWYEYVRLGGKTIHHLNPKLHISGLGYDTDLSFLKNETLNNNFDNKLVYEGHSYAILTDGRRKDWELKTPDKICAIAMKEFDDKLEFVTLGKNPIPLFLSEFGLISTKPTVFLIKNWNQPRNLKFRDRYRLIQDMLQDPRSKLPGDQIIYHPLSGRCFLLVDNMNSSNTQMSDCLNRSHWSYAGNQTPIKLMGSSKRLKVVGNGFPVTVSNDCSSVWKVISDSNIRLAAIGTEGRSLCLDYNPSKSPLILSSICYCLCVSNDESSKCNENPETQWFKLIQTNVEYSLV